MKRFLSYLVFALAVGFATVLVPDDGPAPALPPAGTAMLPVPAPVALGRRSARDSAGPAHGSDLFRWRRE